MGQMREIWVIADTHFDDPNVIRWGKRPFKSIREMNETMIENWNRNVKDGDIVWHLGDVFNNSHHNENDYSIISRLKGIKKLIKGNHDYYIPYRDYGFSSVIDGLIQSNLLFKHIPAHTTEIQEDCLSGNVHGHLHSKKSNYDPRIYKCVSVELTNYTPIHLAEIIKHFRIPSIEM